MARKKGNTDGLKREPYTTSIDSELLRKFKVFCAVHEKYQNEILEELLEKLLDRKGDGGDNGNTN